MSTPSPPPCFAPKGWYCSDLHLLEQCPESWYCRGGLLPPAQCPDAKWSPARSMYLADCGSRMVTDLSVIVAILIVLAGLSLCCWAYADWSQLFATRYTPRGVCVYGDDTQTAEIIYDPNRPSQTRYHHRGKEQVKYYLVPGGAITHA